MKNFDDLIKDLEGPNGEIENFTNKELEEKIGILIRFIVEMNIKEDIWQARFSEFCYQVNKMFSQRSGIKKIASLFNQRMDKIFCKPEF